jgi:hypothetical protein
VCNHSSVISVGRPDSVSQTEIRSFVRIGMTDIKTVVTFRSTKPGEEAEHVL